MRTFLPIPVILTLLQMVAAFSWKSCDDNAAIKIQSLTVWQNQTMMVQVKGQGTLAVDIQSPVKGQITVEKKMFFGWIKLPCIEGIGSCVYEDVCAVAPYANNCPSDFIKQGLPCKCPVAKGSYGGLIKIDMKTLDLPDWLERGQYRIKAVMQENNQPLLCLQFKINFK